MVDGGARIGLDWPTHGQSTQPLPSAPLPLPPPLFTSSSLFQGLHEHSYAPHAFLALPAGHSMEDAASKPWRACVRVYVCQPSVRVHMHVIDGENEVWCMCEKLLSTLQA